MHVNKMSMFKKQQSKNLLDSTILKYIIQISNQAIRKLQIAITVPILIENSTLYSHLTQEEIEIVKNVFTSDSSTTLLCKNKMHSEHTLNSSESLTSRSLNESQTTEPGNNIYTDIDTFEKAVFKMVKVLHSHSSIYKLAKSYQMNISTQSSLFQHHLRYFMDYIISIMYMTPQEENEQNMYYKKIWNNHKNALIEIKQLTANLEALRESKEKEMKSVLTQYRNDKMIIDKLNLKCVEDIQNVSNKYEKKQYFLYKNWEIKREELRQTLEKIKTNFEALKTKNLNTTLNLDNRRVKVEAQLLAIINQFDTDMDNRQTEFDELCEIYEADRIEKASLKEAIKLQDVTYNSFLKDNQDASETYLDEASEFLDG